MFRDYQSQGPLSSRYIKLDINCARLHCFYSSDFRTKMESVLKDLQVRIEMPGYCASAEGLAKNMLVLRLYEPDRNKGAYRLRRLLKSYWCRCTSLTKKQPDSWNGIRSRGCW